MTSLQEGDIVVYNGPRHVAMDYAYFYVVEPAIEGIAATVHGSLVAGLIGIGLWPTERENKETHADFKANLSRVRCEHFAVVGHVDPLPNLPTQYTGCYRPLTDEEVLLLGEWRKPRVNPR